MTASPAVAIATTASPGSLPPRRGRLLRAYRVTWCALALAAFATLIRLLTEPGMEPAVLGLRLVKATVLIAVSTILFRRRQTDAVAGMLSLAFLLWTITSSFDFAGEYGASWPMALDRLRFLLFVLALLLFPSGEWRPAWTRKVAFASGCVFLIGVGEASGLLATRLYLPSAIACVLAALHSLLLRYRSRSSDTEKQQLKWVALGLVAGIGLILSARAGAAIQAPISPILLECLFQLGIVVLALGFLISLLRYRLYDAEAVISRSAAYAVLTLALVATFAASEAMIQMFGQRYFGAGVGDLSSAIAAAIAAVLLTPLHGRITGWAEQHFQRNLAVLKRHLPELLTELAETATPRQVGDAVLPRIDEAIHATRTALMIDDRVVAAYGVTLRDTRRLAGKRQPASAGLFDRETRDALFPLRMALRCPFGSVRGWLLLGPRPDGSRYGKDELDALAEIAPHLRRALIAARQREGDISSEQRRQRVTARSIKELSSRLDALELKVISMA